MSKKISQETFDEVVRENMEEFDLSREEAVQEAVKEFTSQGVDLGMIVTDSSAGASHPVLSALANIANNPDDDLTQHLETVKTECDLDLPRRCLAGQNGYNTLLEVCRRRDEYLVQALDALCALCNGQPDVLNCVGVNFIMDSITKHNSDDVEVLWRLVKLIKLTCVKHEDNRQLYVSNDVIPALMTVLTSHRGDVRLVTECCQTLRTLTLDDDVRVPFGKAHEHAKMIVAEKDALKTFLDISQEHASNRSVVGELYMTLGKLSVRDEFCQEILDLGGLDLIIRSFNESIDNQPIVRQILAVLKALAGNDKVKVTLAQNGGINLILDAMQKHVKQASICELGCAALASLVLRQPRSCQLALQSGAAEAVVKVMQVHPDSDTVQKQACMAVRNLVARSKENIPVFMELGVEGLLNTCLAKHQSCYDEARAALRDMDCKVELRELWKGEKGEIRY